jgi:DUF2075 family protein/predicted GIY-YIG superfamily endonuclease
MSEAKSYSLIDFKGFDQVQSVVKKYSLLDSNWPVVYFLRNRTNGYVGETANVISRLKNHGNHEKKKNLKAITVILSDRFNKSASLDLEAQLIRYLQADGKFTLLNALPGQTRHNYFQKKELYEKIFEEIWQEFRIKNLAKKTIKQIHNSNLFKYSPYKELTETQLQAISEILDFLLDDTKKVMVIEGGAGTGKSVISSYLFKLLNSDLTEFEEEDLSEEFVNALEKVRRLKERRTISSMALAISMTSFRTTMGKVFSTVPGLNKEMVISLSNLGDLSYDLIVVDEAHRLKQRKNLAYHKIFDEPARKLNLDPATTNEMEWVLLRSKKAVFFYDQFQSIRPTDIDDELFISLKGKPETKVFHLKEQLRSEGGTAFSEFLGDMFSNNLRPNEKFTLPEGSGFEFLYFDSLKELRERILNKDHENGLSRLIAGFSWEWKTNKKGAKETFDIEIDGIQLKWNSNKPDWINYKGSNSEVGSIHKTQGYDLNYCGIIFGKEIDYDWGTKKFIINKNEYKDLNGKKGVKSDEHLLNYLLNIYKTFILRGIKGCYVFAVNPGMKLFLKAHVISFNP